MVSVQDTLQPFRSNLIEGDELSSQLTSQHSTTQVMPTAWILQEKISEARGMAYWKATHDNYSEVILKTVWPQVLSEDPVMWRFSTEMEVERQSQITAKGIQKVWEWGYDERREVWWIAYEKIKGLPLADIIKKKALSWVDARALFMSVSECVKLCHRAEVLHRKITPDSIYLTQAGACLTHFQWVEEVKANEVSLAVQLLKAGHSDHRAVLQAPEWLDGAEITSASDVYSLAATLLVSVAPEGKTWKDAPLPFRAAIASGLHVDPLARASIDQFYESLRLSSLSFAYRGTQDDQSQRLWLHEIVEKVREDSLAWHMLAQPYVLSSFDFKNLPSHLLPNPDVDESDVDFQSWGTFDEVVQEVDKANHFQAKQNLHGHAQQQSELQKYAQQLQERSQQLQEDEQKLEQKEKELQAKYLEQKSALEVAQQAWEDEKNKELLKLQQSKAKHTQDQAELTKNQEEFQTKADAWEQAYKGARSIIEQAQQERSSAEEKITSLKKLQEHLKQDQQKLDKEKADFIAAQEALEEERQQLNLQLQVMQADLKKSRSSKEDVLSEMRIAHTQIEESKNEILALRDQRDVLNQEIEEIHRKYRLSHERLDELAQQTQESQNDFDQAQQELDGVRQQIKNLYQEIADKKRELQSQQSEISAQQAIERGEIKKLMQRLDQERVLLQQEKDQLKTQAKEQHVENERIQNLLEEERVQLNQEKSTLELRHTALDEKEQSYNHQWQHLQKEQKKFQQDKQDLRHTAQQLSQEKSKQQEALLKVKHLTQETEIAFESAQNTKKRMEQQQQDAQQDAKELKDSLLESQMRLREDRKEINQQKESVNQERVKVREQSRQLELLKLELEKKEAHLESETTKVEQIKVEIKEVEVRIQNEYELASQVRIQSQQDQMQAKDLLEKTLQEQKTWERRKAEVEVELDTKQKEATQYLEVAHTRAQDAHQKEVEAQQILKAAQQQQEKLGVWEDSLQETQTYLNQENEKLQELAEEQNQRAIKLERQERQLAQREEELKQHRYPSHLTTSPHYDTQHQQVTINPTKEHITQVKHLSSLNLTWQTSIDMPLQGGYTRTLKVGTQRLTWVYCPEGQQKLGNPEINAKPEERPAHVVYMQDGYWLAQTAITQAVWNQVMDKDESQFKHDQYPAEGLTWIDAILFCNRMSHLLGLTSFYRLEKGVRPVVHSNWQANGMRLPTEAEWEYAARAQQAQYKEYAGAHSLSDVAWYSKNAQKTIHRVAQKNPNAWGLYDLCGNVWEWCHDAWHKDAYRYRTASHPIQNPYYEQNQWSARVVRGGSFYDFSAKCTLYTRPGLEANNGYGVGFRPYLPHSAMSVSPI